MNTARKITQTIIEAIATSASLRPSLSKGELSELVERLLPTVEARIGQPVLPEPGETVGVTFQDQKFAALFFDRVWGAPTEELVDAKIITYGATHFEAVVRVLGILGTMSGDDAKQGYVDTAKSRLEKAALKNLGKLDLGTNWPTLTSSARMTRLLFIERKIVGTPIYDSTKARDTEYVRGDTSTLVAAIEGLEVVDIERLSWDQVIEFRRDQQAKTKFRKMRNWLDTEMIGKSASQISDAISTKLDDYCWAVKKHGIQTVSGTISEMLDPRLLSATSATMAGLAYSEGGLWAALGGAGIMIGKAAVSLTQKYVDLKDRKRGQGSEVAFVHELKKLASKK